MRASSSKKEYLISLYHTRSLIALIAGVLVVCLAAAAVREKILNYAYAEENRLHYFTVQSNILAAVGAAFLIPYAIEGIRKKRFTLPRWLAVFHYACASCAAITFTAAMVIILPVQGHTAVTGTDFWMHLIVPICNVILFQCIETGISLDRRDTVIAQIPYWLYMAVYYIEVFVIGVLAVPMYLLDLKFGANFMFLTNHSGNPVLKLLWNLSGGNGGLVYVFALVTFITFVLHVVFGIYVLIGLASRKANTPSGVNDI